MAPCLQRASTATDEHTNSFYSNVVRCNRKCSIQVIFKPSDEYKLQNNGIFDFDQCLDLLRRLVNVGHVLCSGCQSEMIGEASSVQNGNKYCWPYYHLRSRECVTFLDSVGSTVCIHCKRMSRGVRKSLKRKAELTPMTRAKRAQISSKCRIDYLTPRSRRKRLQMSSKIRQLQQKKINKLQSKIAAHDVTVDEGNNKTNGKSSKCDRRWII
jgi:hypothetical protein